MRILLVEDDENLAKALAIILDKHNYLVDVSSDGAMAWEMADLIHYDLVLLDVGLPKVDGISLCRRFRDKDPELPIMLMTVRDSVTDKLTGLDSGADEYLVKPFDFQEFLARIRVLARRFSEKSDAILTFGDIHFNPQAREISCNGQVLPLSRKEYLLLELLLRHPHRVFSRSDIVDHLWSVDRLPTEDTVKSHIRRLRRKLQQLGAEDLIETLYGHGYRVNPTYLRSPPAEVAVSVEQANALDEATAQIWQQIRGNVLKQVSELEAAITTLTPQTDNPVTLQVAQKNAHQIAGTVGSFGFDAASHIARAIESLLAGYGPERSPASLTQLVDILKTELEAEFP
jgi:two-component system OmpR family response regulator